MKNSVNKIINEEVGNYLNEAYVFEGDNFKFQQRINNSTFINYEGFSTDYDLNIIESDVMVNWHIVFWLNQYGIENFNIIVDSVEGTYKIQYLNKQTDVQEQEVEKNISEIKWKFVVGAASLNIGGGLYVSGLNFDFKTNTCDVKF
jgi:hypothetical protein